MTGQIIDQIKAKLRLPVIVAPMFLASTPELVISTGKAGLLGTSLAPNARTIAEFENGLRQISEALSPSRTPWATSMIVHKTYDRFAAELGLICQYQPPLVICALGSPRLVLPRVHAYGGAVFTDVATVEQARKSLATGADGLILLCAGAGGHTGSYSPFAFIEEVRAFWDGPLAVGGAIGSARGIKAALELGADFAYMGTRFLTARETMLSDENRAMIVESGLHDIITSNAPTGLPANWLRASLDASGFGAGGDRAKPQADFSTLRDDVKAWKNIWSAGQSVGRTHAIESAHEIAEQLIRDFNALRPIAVPYSNAENHPAGKLDG